MAHRRGRNGGFSGPQVVVDADKQRKEHIAANPGQVRYCASAVQFMAHHAERLGVTTEEILAAVLRGHTDIPKMQHRDELHETPGKKLWPKVVTDAPVKPAEGPGAMAEAFERAKG